MGSDGLEEPGGRGPVFLKRLTIKGFKSFADSAILEMEPGAVSYTHLTLPTNREV